MDILWNWTANSIIQFTKNLIYISEKEKIKC